MGGSVLSDKDRADLEVVKKENVEIVAVSFVQRPSDIDEVRGIVGPTAQVFAKIERPQALERIDDICRVSDGVMAARGDLGVELPFQVVPAAQHKIARTALRHGVTSICATEMLESMITSTRATRAEVADVTGAVRDGFDAVMLSGETAVGANPVRAVEVMAAICEAAERDVTLPVVFADANPETAAVTAAASSLARRIGADSLLSLTYTGYSARLLAACRPNAPIIAATPTETAARKLKVAWGVYPVVSARDPDVEVSIGAALTAARDKGYVQRGHRVVVCASRLSPRSDADTIWLHTEPSKPIISWSPSTASFRATTSGTTSASIAMRVRHFATRRILSTPKSSAPSTTRRPLTPTIEASRSNTSSRSCAVSLPTVVARNDHRRVALDNGPAAEISLAQLGRQRDGLTRTGGAPYECERDSTACHRITAPLANSHGGQRS
ncbi:MAG: hypothetical protein EBW96_06730 [Actinobacteria bacterium]|nr:hypothetical protein [Actinomycetota bacterium]